MSYSSEVLADSPLLYLRLDETSGTTCANAGSLGGNATAVGTVTRNLASAHAGLGVCCELEGVGANDYISYPDTAALDITGDVTYECWASLDDFSDSHILMTKNSDAGGTTGGYVFFVVLNRNIRVSVGVTTIFQVATAWPASTAWHHVAFTRVGNLYTIYLDGASIGSTTNAIAIAATPEPFLVGVYKLAGGFQQGLDGKIDEVAVYNTGLSAARILAHYNAASAPAAPGFVPKVIAHS